MPSHYDTLQVIPTASDAVIKAAYRALARNYHPDLNPDNAEAEAMMQEINRAHHILSNPSSRAQYDIQNGLRDFYPDVVEVTDSAAGKTTPNKPSSPAANQYAQPDEFPQNRFMQRPSKWALGLFCFGVAAIFSVMMLPNWKAHSKPDWSASARRDDVQELNLRMHTAPLLLPGKFKAN